MQKKSIDLKKEVCFCLIYFKYFGTWLARAAVFFLQKSIMNKPCYSMFHLLGKL